MAHLLRALHPTLHLTISTERSGISANGTRWLAVKIEMVGSQANFLFRVDHSSTRTESRLEPWLTSQASIEDGVYYYHGCCYGLWTVLQWQLLYGSSKSFSIIIGLITFPCHCFPNPIYKTHSFPNFESYMYSQSSPASITLLLASSLAWIHHHQTNCVSHQTLLYLKSNTSPTPTSNCTIAAY